MSQSDVRPVTSEEVDDLRESGWVRLPTLIATDVALDLRERAKARVGGSGTDHAIRPGVDVPSRWWNDYHNIVQDDDHFARIGLSPQMGWNARQLIGRDTGILMWSNLLAVKVSSKENVTQSPPTFFHQDGPNLPMDRSSWIRIWIALDHLSVDMGPLRFIDGSHRLGLLGKSHIDRPGTTSEEALLDDFPALRAMSVSESVEFQPGDATAHTMFTVHGASSNNGSRPRWAFLLAYFSDDTLYTGNRMGAQGIRDKIDRAGLAPGDRFGGSLYPTVPVLAP